MADTQISSFAAECFWPGVTEAAVEALDARARRASRRNVSVEYLGSELYPTDEVVLFRFRAASAEVVRETSERARIPFERIVEWVGVSANSKKTSTERSKK